VSAEADTGPEKVQIPMHILCADSLPDHLLAPLQEAGHEVVVDADLNADTLPGYLTENPAEVLVVRSTKVTADAIAASTSLGLIVRAGAGTDNIDKDAASAAGIYVSNVPGQNAIAVAELAMALLLATDRHIPAGMADLSAGVWNKKTYSTADGIYGQTLAILGLGDIGFALAERANAFGMSVIALRKPGRSTTALARLRSAGITLVDTLEELLATADVVSVHVPKSPDTIGMCNAEFFDKMRDGAIFLNTARGDVVVEQDLLDAMTRKGIRAGLDVWSDEPSAGAAEWTSALSTNPNVIGSHHIGASTRQAQNAVAAGTVAVIDAYLDGRITNCVNLVAEPVGSTILTVRHLDRVGVLAKVFATLRSEGLNIQEMNNQLFTGSVAAVASIYLERSPSDAVLEAIGSDDDILAVSVAERADR
jgi:D-3-phosphoglycerate dehydrogenase